ncbi:hypothetical protein [Pseudomonas chlororaphis]|uniref:hypothetical protein n=1 Tax=Pseudomonas chlororaphis TaxID=587753 RepID=UPI001389BDFB|nr:hypothetical protein [Pseudomonas chlororaphis]WDG45690.1 hypothetical protein PUP58_18170 [Pseudomonas chlororaphis]WDG77334.1 hypothetical protein PUP77_23285 [Pseudomonas chlororaphis]WDG83427.1 hypothetical protein PUP68_21575 [Pseudomonas chlororaphis]
MSDEEPKVAEETSARIRISYEEAVEFFLALTPNGNCPLCKSDRWEIPTDQTHKGDVFLLPAGGMRGGKRAYNLGLECKTCGFVRVHRANLIREWLDGDRAVPEAPSDEV